MDDLRGECRAAGVALTAGPDRWDVVLDAPDHRNAQTPTTWRALAAVGRAVAERRPRVVVLSATGPSFSAGLDRRMLAGTLSGQRPGERGLADLAAQADEELDRTIQRFQDAFTWWREVDAVTVAAVSGHAVGAGFQLALATDLLVLADDARLSMPETGLGLVPDLGGTAALVEAVGYPRALELCVTGRPVGAAEAVRLGIAGWAVPAADLGAAVDALVQALTAGPVDAVVATTRLLRGAAGRSRPQQLAAERAAQAGRLRALARGQAPGPGY